MPQKSLANTNDSPVVDVRNLTKSFHNGKHSTNVLNDISISINEGDFCTLIGPSGCGKSTILRIIAGLESFNSGSKVNVNKKAAIGMVFQEHALFPWMSLSENIELLLKNNPAFKGENRHQTAVHWLEKVGLKDFADYLPHQVSGGMRQRASLARSFAARPDILLLDEPFVFLDYQSRIALQELLLSLWRETKVSILFVTHDIDEAVLLSDRIYSLSSRPATVRKETVVELERPREFIKLRRSSDYQQYVYDLANLLKKDAAF